MKLKANILVLGLFMPGSFFYGSAAESGRAVTLMVSAPLQIPGSVLFPGTYVFRIAQSDPDRRIIQVFDAKETMVFSTFIAVPNRMRASEGERVNFADRPAKKFPAVKAMSFPNEKYLLQFVYDKETEAELTTDVNEPVLWTDAKDDQMKALQLASIRSLDFNGVAGDLDAALQTTSTAQASNPK